MSPLFHFFAALMFILKFSIAALIGYFVIKKAVKDALSEDRLEKTR